MQVKILGPIEVSAGDEQIVLGGPKQRTVLAVLAIRHGQVVSSDELIEAVWGNDLPSNPLNTLQYQIAQLRKLFEDDPSKPTRLVTRSPGYLLASGTTTLDASRFEALIAKARVAFGESDTATAGSLVDAALSLWRGEALADFRYEEFAQGDAARLDDSHLAAEELGIDIALSDGHHREQIPNLSQLTIDHPLREGIWMRQMIALYRDAQQTEALRAYQRAKEALGDVGVEPSAELRSLEQRIIDQDPGLDGPPRRVRPPPNNLVSPPNALIGRADSVSDVLARLRTSRFVTLSGPGGSGKTRLAIEVADQSLDRFPDGVWFVPLDQIDEPSLLPSFVGEIVGMRELPDADVVDNLVAMVGSDRVLLIFDNAEHIAAAAADLIAKLLAQCSNLKVIATSQARLDIQGEVVVEVAPLTLPGGTTSIYDRFEDVDAVALFADRSAAAGADIENWDEDAFAAAANIVAALDGMPLAIELAAARTRSMSLREVADGLSDRFELLNRGPRDAPSRQRTLAGTMEWSVGLLNPNERSALQQLSVCAGDFDIAAASTITGFSLQRTRDALALFVDRSLLRRAEDVAGAARYTMLETLRHYGIQTMTATETTQARDVHLRTYASFVEQAAIGICGPEQNAWLARFDADYANIRAALAWSLESRDLDTGMLLGSRLGRYWDWKGHLKEASEWLTRLSEADAAYRPGRIAVLTWRSYLAWEFGNTETAQDLSDAAAATAAAEGDPVERALALSTRALIARSTGRLDAAREASAEVISLGDDHGDEWMAAWAASTLATIALAAGDAATAAKHSLDTVARFERLGDSRGAGWGYTTLAQAALMQGELDSALEHAKHALSASVHAHDDRNASWVLELLAEVTFEQERFEQSAQLWAAARPLRESRGLTTSISHQDDPIDLEAALRVHLGASYNSLFSEAFADPQSIIGLVLDESTGAKVTA
jgi:predicted ATPase/DNA-binding SARP family transcriptional activator